MELRDLAVAARFLRFQHAGLREMRADRRFAGVRTGDALMPALRWAIDNLRGPDLQVAGEARTCAVILLSYKRPANMDLLVRAALRCEFVSQVILSNNNPAVRIADWVGTRDPRLEILEHHMPVKQGVRIQLAADGDADHLISIDDDLFLSPEQIALLFCHLVADPTRPHGFAGEVRMPPGAPAGRYRFRVDVTGDREVDHLTQVYAFTRAQARRAAHLAAALGISDLGALGNGEDLLLSASGDARPRVHPAGPIARCWSAGARGIATWRTHRGFFRERERMAERLAELAGATSIERQR
jgi:hypothetical protein